MKRAIPTFNIKIKPFLIHTTHWNIAVLPLHRRISGETPRTTGHLVARVTAVVPVRRCGARKFFPELVFMGELHLPVLTSPTGHGPSKSSNVVSPGLCGLAIVIYK